MKKLLKRCLENIHYAVYTLNVIFIICLAWYVSADIYPHFQNMGFCKEIIIRVIFNSIFGIHFGASTNNFIKKENKKLQLLMGHKMNETMDIAHGEYWRN